MITWLFHHTPLFLMTQSFWRDEAYTAILSSQPVLNMVKITAHDFNPPLYYLIMHFLIRLLGSSELVLRSFSLICLAGTVLGGVLILEYIGTIRSKWIYVYGALLALNPVLLYYGFEARMYSLFALLVTFSWYFLFKKQKKRYMCVTSLGLYTHYFFIFAIVCQALVLLIQSKKTFLQESRQYFLVPSLAFLPWFLYVLPHLFSGTSNFWIPKVTSKDFPVSMGMFFTGYERVWGFYDKSLLPISYVILFCLAYLIFSQWAFIKKNMLAKALIIWTFVPFITVFLISLVKPLYVPRYIIFANVGCSLLLAYLIDHEKLAQKLIILLLIFAAICHYSNYEVKYKRKADIRKEVSQVYQIIDEKHLLYLSDPKMYFTVRYYYPQLPVYIYGDKKHTAAYVGLSLIPDSAFRSTVPTYPQKAILLKRDGSFEGVSMY